MALKFLFPLVLASVANANDPVIHSALLDVWKNLGGADGHWKNSSGWDGDDYCKFVGVKCEMHTEGELVTELKLANNNLTGTLPSTMINMKDLKVVDLSHNSIGGELPDNFAAFSQVTNLILSNNQIGGRLPTTIMNVTYPYPTWREINLANNLFTGPIPETWFGPEHPSPFDPILGLQILNLGYNKLTGGIPKRIESLHRLTTLLVDYNDLSGELSDSILDTWLGTRKYCSLAGNNWTCPIPSSLQSACKAYCS